MAYFYLKAFHLIFVITWFAGLFYIPRLFVYQIEAFQKPSPDKEILGKQLKLMAKRLWFIITWPSAILALVFGLSLFYINPALFYLPWMQVKIGFILLLFIYHLKTHQYYKQLQNDEVKKTSSYMRIWNEGATFILFAVIFLVILKSAINWIWGIIGIVVLGILIMLGFKLYKNFREKNPEA
ncbi:CopD family protein [Jejuia pallidilutea]|jgi:putative membrane protein|uniref:Protoporphyrinogen IX oxidase n=1 Tax=Jejuia pallidilutea TaxID=504487 RepID=A0A090VME3_9FLAO|nr:CopD family protein [Jejuia pallidilutea]PQV45258.1 putative membrane protein [Jejuia pallidilutea]GAL65198.1 protoporphyrinogen IX oxidase novel form HemJ [Jejuia pallidilutea]GAL69247.1 protoporphyrinogen IX oxidase [Jejuia pallidilutea]GAL89203.1 protoporphyrinogen IX oxidase novel form HemJ [Jejuia pallidilutea]